MKIALISVDSYRLIEEEIKKIIKDEPYIFYNLNEVKLSDVIEQASYNSMFEEKKNIIVYNADLFGTKSNEKDLALLENYLKKPNINTSLIFCTRQKIDKRKKIVKLFKNDFLLVDIENYDYLSLYKYIENYFKSKKFKINYEDQKYIVDYCKGNFDLICNELDKVLLYYSEPCEINSKDLIKILGKSVENSGFKFVSAAVNKDLGASLKILKDLQSLKKDCFELVFLLAREYRLMYYFKYYLSLNCSFKEICQKLGLLEWQVQKINENVIKYDDDELLNNLKMLANIDLGVKRGLVDKEIALKSFLVSICG
ncbi:MAG: DNA polymerase III subunit delta [Firmicutes bacterium]|nr:DNA polymerase III subunit delta [Bacillota bacterium]